MIHERKVAKMTRMAAYEAREGKKDAEVCGYFRSDYVGFQMVKAWAGVTVAFFLLAGIFVLYRMDEMMASLYRMDLNGIFDLGKRFVFAYAAVCVLYMAAAYVLAHLSYKKARDRLARYEKALEDVSGSGEEES